MSAVEANAVLTALCTVAYLTHALTCAKRSKAVQAKQDTFGGTCVNGTRGTVTQGLVCPQHRRRFFSPLRTTPPFAPRGSADSKPAAKRGLL